MKVTELMVGDWVYIHEPECKGHRIDSIDELDGQVGADGEVYDECDIRPIPLSGDLFTKNGFTEQGDGCEWSYYEEQDGKGQYMILWNKNYDYLEISSYTEDYGEFFRSGIRFLHEAQQAMRLCGIKKELVID